MKTTTAQLTTCAMFTALTAVLAQISLPIGPVPINLAHVAIFLAAGLLGAKYGALSQIVYLLLGTMGVPVFSGFSGGISVLAGPTGGFLIGYVACAFVTGWLIQHSGSSMKHSIPAMIAGILLTYAFGTAWYRLITGASFRTAFSVCVFPFLFGDSLKLLLASVLIRSLQPYMSRRPGQSAGRM